LTVPSNCVTIYLVAEAPSETTKDDQMTLIANYKSKKECRENVGEPLNYTETSFFGPQYKSNGTLTVANRPHITGLGREWFGQVTLENGLITKVT